MLQDMITETKWLDLARIAMIPEILEAIEASRQFLFDNFYLTPTIVREADKSKRAIIELFEHFLEHSEQMNLEMFGLKSHEDTRQVRIKILERNRAIRFRSLTLI